ncbi:FAD/NAD(P)-binding domain-containing protein [Camillea tinctor]|nr:FAD/NAD(P)-binding domain-containing protein [Camillea tinctor]
MAQDSLPTFPTPPKAIIILGGSYGGISTAHYLLKHVVPRLPDSTSYQVILASAATQAMCRPACPRALISDDMFPQDKLFVNIREAFAQYSAGAFRFIHGHGHAEAGEPATLTLSYHALVIATGASTPALPRAKRIVIAGGGASGVETAGELGEHLNGSGSKSRDKVDIVLVTGGAQILPGLRSSIAQKAESYLARLGVTVQKNTRVKSVVVAGGDGGAEYDTERDVASAAVVTLADGAVIQADLYLPATGTRPNTGFLSPSLLAVDGRVETNSATLRVDGAGPRVYAIGDAASWAQPAVHNILTSVPVLCANAKRDLLLAAGKGGKPENGKVSASSTEDRVFKEDTREMQMVPIGRSKGVGAAMGHRLPSFMVWMIKGRDYWLWSTKDLWNGKQWAKE